MLTRIGMAPRKAGLDVHKFQAHWGGRHGELASQMPGVSRYWQNHEVLENGEPLLPWAGFDACSDFDFESIPAMDAAFASDQYQIAVRADEANIVDKTKGGLLLTERNVEGSIDLQKNVRLLTFFRLAPQRASAELAAALKASPKPSQATARETFIALHGAEAAQRLSIFDAVEGLWFEAPEEALRFIRSDEARDRRSRMADLVRGTERLLARVRVIV